MHVTSFVIKCHAVCCVGSAKQRLNWLHCLLAAVKAPMVAIMEIRPCFNSTDRRRLKAATSPSEVKPTGSQKPTGACTPSSFSKAHKATFQHFQALYLAQLKVTGTPNSLEKWQPCKNHDAPLYFEQSC
jgi:hypothetical protein